MTPACGPNSTSQVLELNRREAKKLLLSEIKPSYPALARVNYIGGRVQLLVTVNCHGKVQQIHVVRGHPFLAVAALDAIRRWVYHPFETASGPAGFETLVDVNFSLVGPNFTTPSLPPQPDKFLARWVRPPRVVSGPGTREANGDVRLRVLVSKKGRVVDSTLLSGPEAELAVARKTIARWKFRPARWGTLNVPWYMEINVPVRGGQRKKESR
jgi:TonB family protein